jgi:hypothetical protein
MLLGRRSDCGWLAGKLGKLSSFVRAYVCLFSTSRHGSASMFWSSDKRNGSKLGRFWNAVARVFNHCRKSEVEIYFVILQCSGARAFACQGWWAMPHASRRTRPPSSGHLEKYPFRAAYKSDSKNLFEFDHRERVRWGNWVSLI